MNRSDLRIKIDGEDISSSASYAFMVEDYIGTVPQWNIVRGLKTGLSLLTIMTLVNTVPIGDAFAKTKSTPSAIIERGEDRTSYGILAEALDDRMTDDEFNKAMAALADIWRACPEDLPKDLSARHDHYLSGAKG
jgi:hypothetical protein